MDEHPGVIWAAGAAAVALVAVLVVAVVRMSDPSVAPALQLPATSETRYTTYSTSTSYVVPSVQTSEDGGGPAPTDAPTTGDPATDEPAPISTSSTTPANPYGTTTPTNAGHV